MLKVKINTLKASLNQNAGENAAIREKIDRVDSDLAHGIDLPFSVNLEVSRSAIFSQAGTSVSATDIKVNACSEGDLLNVDTINSIKIHLSHYTVTIGWICTYNLTLLRILILLCVPLPSGLEV